MRQLIKNIELLTNKLEIGQLLGTQPKEYISMRQTSIKFKGKTIEMKNQLNKLLSNFSNQNNANLFYSLILAVNDFIEVP